MDNVPQMPFTYATYRSILQLLQGGGYSFCGYDNWGTIAKPVILRHDIDFVPSKAVRLAQIEAEERAKSTFFFLLRSDFYNVMSKTNLDIVKEIAQLGHDVGLHFDEALYASPETAKESIIYEANVLRDAVGIPIKSVSMHRPSKNTLNGNWVIPGMINSYSKTFFSEFEYLSDSRRHWKRSIIDAIESSEHNKLHILTHPFWYGERDAGLRADLELFVDNAKGERLATLANNFTKLDDVFDGREIRNAKLAMLRRQSFNTERLLLRPLRVEDAADMFEYTSDSSVCRFLKWTAHQSVAESAEWIQSKVSVASPDDLLMAITLKDKHKLIGVIRVFNIDKPPCSAELSYILNPLHQGQGFMNEAGCEAVRICFEELGLDSLFACVDDSNTGSARVAEQLGMMRQPGQSSVIEIKGQNRLHSKYLVRKGDK